MAGTRTRTDDPLRPARAVAEAHGIAPVVAAAAIAEALARRSGASLRGSGLRIDAHLVGHEGLHQEFAAVLPEAAGPDVLGLVYERLLEPSRRRRTGTHLTPVELAARLLTMLPPGTFGGTGVPTVLDPAVGAGTFLLAAAEAMAHHGHRPAEIMDRLRGVDIDPDACAIAEAALALWAVGHGEAPTPNPAGVVVGDGLLDPLPPADVVIGNPPFLNQLRRSSAASSERRAELRARWGDLLGPYTDEAWLFLAAALDAVDDDGCVLLVQPVSVLAARDGAPVRRRLLESAALEALWVADGRVFDAAVEVCVPLLVRGGGPGEIERTRRFRGPEVAEVDSVPVSAQDAWGRMAAPLTGVPDVSLPVAGGRVGDVATVTAGCRDQFYGFVPHLREAPSDTGHEVAPLVTVGMIDPFRMRWGSGEFSFAKRKVTRPTVDLAALAVADPGLRRWVDDRQKPKVLVATQTRVVELWVDEAGTAVPVTPTIAIEPNDPSRCFHLAAAVAAPVVSAEIATQSFGTALSVRALKTTARDLAALPLPIDAARWDEAASLARELQATDGPAPRSLVLAFGAAANAAHGVYSPALVEWWCDRWPQR